MGLRIEGIGMKIKKSIIISQIVFAMFTLPSVAKINGEISKSHIYDVEKTIMSEIIIGEKIQNEEYWDENLTYFSKYKPLFMLSNKELFNFNSKPKRKIIKRVVTPSVYRISLKNSSIKPVSNLTDLPVQEKSAVAKLEMKTVKEETPELLAQYKKAKGQNMDSDKKIEIATVLKSSQKTENYTLAIDLLNDVTEQEPYNAYAFYLKGEIYSVQKDLKNAIMNYAQALKINPSSKKCCLGIAKAIEPTNKELAQKYYNKAK